MVGTIIQLLENRRNNQLIRDFLQKVESRNLRRISTQLDSSAQDIQIASTAEDQTPNETRHTLLREVLKPNRKVCPGGGDRGEL